MIQEKLSGPQSIVTFTGDTLLYDPVTHHYTTVEGEPLLSGSKYAEEFGIHFDRERWLRLTAKKLDTTEEFVAAAWDLRGQFARNFGTAIHQTMECYFKYNAIGYGVPKHPFLKEMVESFPLLGKDIRPEIMVSDLARGLVGQIDALLVTGEMSGTVLDYKSDAAVEKNLFRHFNQLSFYAHILRAAGWTIDKVVVWNYVGYWSPHESEVLPLKLGID